MAREYYGNNNEPTVMSDIQAAVACGAALGDPRTPLVDENAGVYTVVPKEYALKSLEDFLPRPLRIRENVHLYDTDSFIGYVNGFKRDGESRVFFDGEREQFVAVLDYHGQEPSWCDHTATFKPRRSVEFETWMGKNRHQMAQVEFARFLEDNMPDVVEPDSADLLQVALTFEAKKTVEFASGVRLSNGQIQFQYDEVVRGAAQKGTIEIPEQFVLGISIHMNGPAYRIPVRLRWRLAEGKLVFWYEVVRPHRFVEDAFKEIRERVAKETAVPLLAGSIEQ